MAPRVKLSEPTGPRPPLPGAAKMELNWTQTSGRVAHNIAYLQFANPADATVIATLQAAADGIFHIVSLTSGLIQCIGTDWKIGSVTVSDYGGTTEGTATSSGAPVAGQAGATAVPPQCAVCISWEINARYRGGKPRWYIPGVPTNALPTVSNSQLAASYCTQLQQAAALLESDINGLSPNGHDCTLGTISFYSGYELRPVPLFRVFDIPRVHERLDSQRRRSGKENAFPSVP